MLFILTACSTTPLAPSNLPISSESTPVFQESLTLTGRLSVQYRQANQTRILQGQFTWVQTPDNTTLTVRTPWGTTLATIHIAPNSCRFIQADQTVYTAPHPDALAAQLGWPLPLSHFPRWLQGFAMDAHGSPLIATPRNTTLVTQDAWRLHYTRWEQISTQSLSHPKQIDLEHLNPTPENTPISIRILLDSWTIP